MPRLRFTQPCNDCPFRRNSLQGWLGSSSPEQFSATTQAEAHMPCHQTIEYDDPDWQASQYPDSSLCAGSLIHIRNQFKMPRDAGLAAGVRMVPMDPVNVFQWPQEFIDHHNSGEFKSWQKQERTGRPKTTRSA